MDVDAIRPPLDLHFIKTICVTIKNDYIRFFSLKDLTKLYRNMC